MKHNQELLGNTIKTIKTLKRLKLLNKVAKYLAYGGFFFWVGETLYFLIEYGWHFQAINQAERICDNIVSVCWLVAFLLALYVFLKVGEIMLDEFE